MKILSSKKYYALLEELEHHKRMRETLNESNRILRINIERRKLNDARVKFAFDARIRRAVIGRIGAGKTTFLKHVAQQMPGRCRAFNLGGMNEFNILKDKLAELCTFPNPTISDIVCAAVQRGRLNLIDNVAHFGIDESQLISKLVELDCEFIITSPSSKRIEPASLAGHIDFVYAYPTDESGYYSVGPHASLEARTLLPENLKGDKKA